MLHDETIWPDPFTFSPDRFTTSLPQRDPREVCFGFGRRKCPGMYLAEAALSMTISMTLAVFEITNVVENGVPVAPKHENTSGTIRCVFFFLSLTHLHMRVCLTSVKPTVIRKPSNALLNLVPKKHWH